ncbi:MAG: hypothetical protein RI883_1518 [Bacteroidota bacterium]|jgi:MoaA/NifB/PqqE/SkfB family radical SAM enzyme
MEIQPTETQEEELKNSIQVLEIDYSEIRAEKKQEIVSGFLKSHLHRKRIVKNALVVLRLYKTPSRVIRILKMIKEKRNTMAGGENIFKVVSVADQHYCRINIPPWESPLFHPFLLSELNRLEKHNEPTHRLTTAFLAITKKCPLKCEHCFEWDNLNQPEKISTSDIDQMIEKLQSIGTLNISFTGGEPMLRVKELVNAIQKYKHKSAFWILTSGFNFTADNAAALKAAGLTGLIVSIDHHDAYQHDIFRGKEGSFRDALYAVKYSIENEFITVVSTCITRATATREYLDQFMLFAKDLGVGFVQFFEPKAVGHYAMKDVLLAPEQIEILEEVLLTYNNELAYKDFPIIVYHGYYQRRMGCMVSGNRAVYVDTNGDFLSCSFCHQKSGSLLDPDFKESIEKMSITGCVDYGNSY